MKNFQSFDFLKKISFERLGGSANEKLVADMLFDYCQRNNVDVLLEEFLVDYPTIITAKLVVDGQEYRVSGYGNSGSTPEEGITAPLKYIEKAEEVNMIDCKGKIVLIQGRITYLAYKRLIDHGVVGFICTSGSLYDNPNNTDLEEISLRERHYTHGKIPGLTIRIKDAQAIILANPQVATIILKQTEEKKSSYNVVATLPGESMPEKIIAFTAHYDSVRFSDGAYDNATGTTTIMELLAYYLVNPHRRTLKFIWCGSEEMGLLGSRDYCERHKEELKNYDLNINVDMTGVILGSDIACCSSEMDLVSYLNYFGKIKGFPIQVRQGVYSSDSTPFADYGVPSLSFARLSTNGGAEIHSRKDVLSNLDSNNYYKTCEFIEEFANQMINSVLFPVSRTIPDVVKKDLDKYNGRDDLKNQ